jgi:hypothetical protein
MKFCNKCKTSKLEKEFNKDKNCKDGLRPQCKMCIKQYYENNKEKIHTKQKWYRENNKEKIHTKQKWYRENNKEKVATRQKLWYNNNKERIVTYWQSSIGKLSQKRTRIKKLLTSKGRLNQNISIAINQSLKRNGSSKNGCHWETLVGYTVQQLKPHLEKQFEDWMNWFNYGHGKDKWCIDHKRPIASFDFDSPKHSDFKKCWALKNLRPMRCSENFSKGAKI